MGNEESKKSYNVDINNFKEFEKDVVSKFGNYANGNFAFKKALEAKLGDIWLTYFHQGIQLDGNVYRHICNISDKKIELTSIENENKKVILEDGFEGLRYYTQYEGKNFDRLFKSFDNVLFVNEENGLSIYTAHSFVDAKDDFSMPNQSGTSIYQSFTKDGIERRREYINLASIPFLGKKSINDVNIMTYPPLELLGNRGLKYTTGYEMLSKQIYTRRTVDTVNVLYEDYHAGRYFDGELPIDDRDIHSFGYTFTNIPSIIQARYTNSEYNTPIMPEPMEKIEEKIQRVPVEFQEALRKMAPARVNYSNDKIPEISFETRGMAR